MSYSISKCIDPRIITNPYTGEKMSVPCGRCAGCRNRRSQSYVQRLEQERLCWRYAFFFTLTYDEKNLPRIYRHGAFCVVDDFQHLGARKDTKVIHFDLHELDTRQQSDIDYFYSRKDFGFVSVYDAQSFIKRLRINLEREHLRHNTYLLENLKKDSYEKSFRYFICGEYGHKKTDNYRPHYHGLLFFNSEFTASCIERLVRKSWQLGITDTSFESSNARNYVARYITCYDSLPAIYRYRQIRPFCLFSKSPSLGSLATNTDDVRENFFNITTKQHIFDVASGKYVDVPFWRSYIDRLYPKVSGFDRISHYDRVTLYKSAKGYEDPKTFIVHAKSRFVRFRPFVEEYFKFYCNRFYGVGKYDKFDDFLLRLFYISKRVIAQSAVFGITVDKYIEYIEKFYIAQDYDKLCDMYKYEEHYSKDHTVTDLACKDLAFVYEYRYSKIDELSDVEVTIFKSYGFDLERMFNDDEDERDSYWNEIDVTNTYDYKSFKLQAEYIDKNNCKTKHRHGYIEDLPF